MPNKHPKFTTSARLAWGAVLIGTVVEVIASFIPIAIMKNMLSYVAYGAGFLIVALIYHKQKEKMPVILAAIVAMLVVGTFSVIGGSLGAEVSNWIKWGRIDIFGIIYSRYGCILVFCASVFTCLGIFYVLSSWFDGTFQVSLVRVALLAFVPVVVLVVVTAVLNGNGGSKKDQCGICKGSGLVNEGFINLKTCPVCKGSGVDFH